jgi:hypothetical protein
VLTLREAAAAQSGGNCFSVGAADTAPEVLNVVCFHIIEFINATPSASPVAEGRPAAVYNLGLDLRINHLSSLNLFPGVNIQ